MMNKEQAWHSFWAGFTYSGSSIPAYDETSTPDDASMPRITYEGASDNFGEQIASSASVWTRSSSWAEAEAIKKQIEDAITRGGVMIRTDTGAIWLKRGRPFSQRLGDPSDDLIRRIVINLEVEFID